VSAIKRAVTAVRSIINDPVERRAYLARLKFLATGTEGVQAWSLEYRAGLHGRFEVSTERIASDAEVIVRSPVKAVHNPLSHLYERRHVYRLSDTIVSTSSGATLMCGTPEPPFFIRESIPWPFESVLAHGLEIPSIGSASADYAGPHAIFPTTSNYYHWLVEDLPMVLRVQAAAPEANLLAYGAGQTNRHGAVAAHIGMQLVAAPLVVHLQEQVLPGRASDSFFIHPRDLAHLRNFGTAFTESKSVSPHKYPERIYVSRSKSRRPLANENELERLLAGAGFAIVHLEELPWIEQIRFFQNARLIVGPHGAGLANLVFANPGSTVVEFTVGYMFNRCFEWISTVAGHRYIPVEADSLPAASSAELLFRDIQRLID
jgi:hypothetical protein